MPDTPKPPPRVVVFAGPNGAGKSTHADALLAALGIETFVNADYIARGLSGQHPERVALAAGRIMLARWAMFDNSHAGHAELIAEQAGHKLKVFKERTWQKLQKLNNAH